MDGPEATRAGGVTRLSGALDVVGGLGPLLVWPPQCWVPGSQASGICSLFTCLPDLRVKQPCGAGGVASMGGENEESRAG